jgi:hypothetical protein
MQPSHVKTYSDGIWISADREQRIVKQLDQQLSSCGFGARVQNADNFGYPYIYARNDLQVNCRLIDSVFFTDPDLWTQESAVIITDNHPIRSVPGRMISVLPEFWSVWHFDPIYINRTASTGYNCFMNRPRGDRSIVFYELIKRNLLEKGFVSYNCDAVSYEQEFVKAELTAYTSQGLVPYNTVELHGTLEQCVIDSNISLVLETYTSDSHIVFSEKLFRCLQLPRPWLLYCSPGSIELLQAHGFDVLADYTNISYDQIGNHGRRLSAVLDQLETFVDRQYSDVDYARFAQAAQHNNQLLQRFAQTWPIKFDAVLTEIQQL